MKYRSIRISALSEVDIRIHMHLLAACGLGFDATKGHQTHLTPSTFIQISVVGKPNRETTNTVAWQ
jgi:hypothetical protein